MLPAFSDLEPAPNVRSAAAAYLASLLAEAAPGLEVVAIARRPGVLALVAVRDPVMAVEAVELVRGELDAERIEVVRWDPEPRRFIARALGMAIEPPMVLNPALGHVSVLVGEIDLRGRNGWRGINRLLASALTGWRIRLVPIAESAAWRSLEVAHATRRSVLATVVGGTRVNVRGLFAELPRALALLEGDEIEVRITRMNADEGTIRVARAQGRNQLALSL